MTWIKMKYNYFFSLLSERNAVVFGLLLAAVFGVYFWFVESEFNWVWLGLGLLQICFIFLFNKVVIRSEYAILSLITQPIGLLVSLCFLGITYYFVFAPISLFRKRKYKVGWIKSAQEINPSQPYE